MDISGSMQGAGGVGGLLAIHEASGNGSVKAGQTLYPTFDGNGNITRIIDSSSNVVCSYAYDPFGSFENPAGNNADSSGYAAEQPFGFSTKYRDTETGLYYYGYRYYDPVTGRWPSRDPVEERGGMNLYGFVYNIPIGWIDDLGHRPQEVEYDMAPVLDIIDDALNWMVENIQVGGAQAGMSPLPGGGAHEQAHQAEINAGKSVCDKYPLPSPNCMRGNVSQQDDYTERAKKICYDFMDMFKGSIFARRTAQMLVDAEKECQKLKCCKDRNSCRYWAHIYAYSKSPFPHPFLGSDEEGGYPNLPEDGWKLGMEELLPDFLDSPLP